MARRSERGKVVKRARRACVAATVIKADGTEKRMSESLPLEKKANGKARKYRLLGRWLKVVIQETDGEVPFVSEDIACQKRGRGDWDNHHPNPCECIFYAFSNITGKLLSFYCTE